MSRNPALAKIHIAKKELGLDDCAYRAVIMGVTQQKKDSSAKLTAKEQQKLLDRFKEMGWKPKQQHRKKSTNPLVRKVFALWGELGRKGKLKNSSRTALCAFVKRMANVDDPEWMNDEEANIVIEALKKMGER